MKLLRREFVGLFSGTVALTVLPRLTYAQTYPERFVRLVIPFPPGGSADPVARLLASRLSEVWGQTVVPENRAGAGGNTAAIAVSQSPPDGYTMFVGGDFLASNRFLYASSIDPVNDLAPASRICSFTNVMVVPNTSPAKSVADFIAFCKANRGAVTFASSGSGASPHLSGELFKRMAGVELTHVPYRGGGPALNDLLPGRVHVMFATMPSVLPLIEAGTVRALGVTSAERSPFLPNVPSIAEAGVAGFDVSSWYGLFLPAKTPPDIIKKVHENTVAVINEAPVRQRFRDIATIAESSSPAELRALLQAQLEKWGPIIKELGIKAD